MNGGVIHHSNQHDQRNDSMRSELPVIDADLIPLNLIIHSIVNQAYNDLLNLSETLPHSSDQVRKRAIVDYVLQTRRQLLKLLVLVRWSSQASQIETCMSIIGFLSRQNYEFDNTVSTMTQLKGNLAGARVRNYDLTTALDVLTTGSNARLPSCIQESFSQPDKLSDHTVLETVEELNDILRWRLASVERVPRRMRERHRIADGRVTFVVPGMWEAAFTYGGGDSDNPIAQEWYLLSLRFLFEVKDARGVWSAAPDGPIKEHIVELCNRELARRTKRPPEQNDAARYDDGSTRRATVDAPLVRAYNFLQRLVLSYQIEAVYTQAAHLAATTWNGHLRIEMSKDRQSVKIEYRSSSRSDPHTLQRTTSSSQQNLAATQQSQIVPPSLTFSIQALAAPSSTTAAAPEVFGPVTAEMRRKALNRALDRASGLRERDSRIDAGNGEQNLADEDETEAEVDSDLKIEWTADELSPAVKAEVDLRLGPDLDLQGLLENVAAVHARESTLTIYHRLVSELGSQDVQLVNINQNTTNLSSHPANQIPVPVIRVHLCGAHYVLASINVLSGRFEFRAEGEASSVREARLRNAADKVDKDRKACGETLLRVKASTIVDEVDSRAAYLGLQTSRRLPFRTAELTRLGLGSRSFLFIHLGPSSSAGAASSIGPSNASARRHSQAFPSSLAGAAPGLGMSMSLGTVVPPPSQQQQQPSAPKKTFYLTLVLGEHGFKFALVAVREMTDQMASWSVMDEIGWLKKPGSASGDVGNETGAGDGSGFDVSIEDLKSLHRYCIRRLAYFNIEQQLNERRIPYRAVAPLAIASTADTTLPFESATAHQEAQYEHQTPYLVVRTSDLLRNEIANKIAYPNLAIQCGPADDENRSTSQVIRTTFHVRFRRMAGSAASSDGSSTLAPFPIPDAAHLPPNVAYEPRTGALAFMFESADSPIGEPDVDSCVDTFLRSFAVLAKSIMQARHQASVKAAAVSAAAASAPASGSTNSNPIGGGTNLRPTKTTTTTA